MWRHVAWALGALGTGAAFIAAPVYVGEHLLSSATISFRAVSDALQVTPTTAETSSFGLPDGVRIADSSLVRPEASYETRTLEAASLALPTQGKAIVADLGEMMIRLYEDGTVQQEYRILSKGKPGSLWETPTGAYAIKTKEENHYSTIGNVWMPSSMQFFGNFFIHGWPYYPNGALVPEGFSGGCIRLSAEDAKTLFEHVDISTPVLVTNGTSLLETPQVGVAGYAAREQFVPPPVVSAQAAIVGDLESGFVFYEKNLEAVHPIASLSKLMTALISLETINQSRMITISKDDADVYGDAGGLHAGDTLTAQELLWPLLLSSSNDAAYALAHTLGEKTFVELMNEKAKGLGLIHTAFREPSGLDALNQSSVLDLFRFTQHLWHNKRSVLDLTRVQNHKAWRNIHPFVAKDSFLGGKTGYIPEAQKTIVAVFSVPFGEFEERSVAIVALGSENIRADVERLRVWAKDNFSYGLRATPSNAIVRYTPPPAGQRNETLSLLFAGDIMMDRGVEAVIQKEGKGDWSFPFAHISSELTNADVAFANLEGPVSDEGTNVGSAYSFRMNPEVISALTGAGFDVVSFANNHVGDWGKDAFEDTMRRLRRAGIAYAGAGWNAKEAHEPAIVERNGKRVGFLAFSDVGPAHMAAREATSGIALASVESVENAVRQARQNTDILVVSFHFGDEYADGPSARQRTLARAAIDAGAKIVIGHHPHVVQSIEEYNHGIIAYSLGNFVFDQYFSKETMSGVMVKIEFKGDKIVAIIPMPVTLNSFYQPSVE